MAAPTLGRPSGYSDEITDILCEEIATSDRGLEAICQSNESLPDARSIYRWLENNANFRQKYARARERQAEFMALQVVPIADDAGEKDSADAINRARLRIDARKWLASKLAPKKYGDKLELSGDAANPLTIAVEYVQRGHLDRAPDGIIDARPRPAIDAPKSEE